MHEGDASGTASAPAYDVVDAWHADPHPPGTIALCNWLAGVGPEPWPVPNVDRKSLLVFGQRAASEHGSRPAVLLALGRMFLAWRELSAALTTLVRAATLAPHEPLTFRLLGEVLFRRGDPVRAARVLDRAMAAGMTDADTRAWHAAARSYATQPNGVTAPMPVAPPPPFADALLVGAPESRSSSGERSVPHAAIDQLTGDPSRSSRPPPPYSYRAPAPDALQGEMVDPASFHEVG